MNSFAIFQQLPYVFLLKYVYLYFVSLNFFLSLLFLLVDVDVAASSFISLALHFVVQHEVEAQHSNTNTVPIADYILHITLSLSL